jgi:hypothetical protein
MTTCLDENTCPNDKLYNVVCNFSIGYIDYECDSRKTCKRADGTYDCCSINVNYWTYPASLLRIPTIQPSTIIRETNCNEICNSGIKIDKCNWYEILKTDNLCGENSKNEYCCSQNREDCCSTNKTVIYILFACISGILIIFAYYLYYIKKSRSKIIPVKDDVAEVEIV